MGGFWWDIATAVGLGVFLGNLATVCGVVMFGKLMSMPWMRKSKRG